MCIPINSTLSEHVFCCYTFSAIQVIVPCFLHRSVYGLPSWHLDVSLAVVTVLFFFTSWAFELHPRGHILSNLTTWLEQRGPEWKPLRDRTASLPSFSWGWLKRLVMFSWQGDKLCWSLIYQHRPKPSTSVCFSDGWHCLIEQRRKIRTQQLCSSLCVITLI